MAIDWQKLYEKETGDKRPFNGRYPDTRRGEYRVPGKGKMVQASKEEYDAAYALVHEHWARYKKWLAVTAAELLKYLMP